MQTNKIIVASLLFFFIGCKKNDSVGEKTVLKESLKSEKISYSKSNSTEKSNDSFVISCGSGCAMTYNVENITGDQKIKKVQFKIDTYIDNALSETSNEVYFFYYNNQSNEIEKIIQEGQKEDILENLLPDAVESFRNFANSLVKKEIKNIESKDTQNNDGLPYNKTINHKTIKYSILNVNAFKGISKFVCDINSPRYLSLPSKKDIEIILVPQDCGDFSYRYYLLTIKNKNVIGNLYVEGEWYEPDDEENKETTSFSIDTDYIINVKTQNVNSSVVEKYQIQNDGNIVKL